MSSKMMYKATKLPSYVLDEAELARAKVLTNIQQLKDRLPPEILKPTMCPICKSKMQGFELRASLSYYQCPECGYKQPGIDVNAAGTDVSGLAAALGLEVLFGLGIAALLYLLSQGE